MSLPQVALCWQLTALGNEELVTSMALAVHHPPSQPFPGEKRAQLASPPTTKMVSPLALQHHLCDGAWLPPGFAQIQPQRPSAHILPFQ